MRLLKTLRKGECWSTLTLEKFERRSSVLGRMNDDRIPKQILYNELTHGKRSTGGQIKRYKNVIHSVMKKFGVKDTWEELCQDRSNWRAICYITWGVFSISSLSERLVCPEFQRATDACMTDQGANCQWILDNEGTSLRPRLHSFSLIAL